MFECCFLIKKAALRQETLGMPTAILFYRVGVLQFVSCAAVIRRMGATDMVEDDNKIGGNERVGGQSQNHDPRYPIGKFTPPAQVTAEDLRYAIQTLAEMPELLREAVRGLDDEQMDTPYREGGWTVRQVVHHLADSHMTAFHRLRRALTEDWPVVPGYDEKAFAELPDLSAPAEWSLELIESVHARWVMLLQAMTEAQWQRGFKHVERGPSTLDQATVLYAWHSRHHVAHINHLRAREDW
jgi:hypothetical protein